MSGKDFDPQNPRILYEGMIPEALKPSKDRRKIAKTRSGKMVSPRRHCLAPERALEFLKGYRKTGVFPNPYRIHGKYWAFVESLSFLGVDKEHSFILVRNKMKELLSGHVVSGGKDAWLEFDQGRSRNPSTGKDSRGKIIQNAIVLQRLHDNNPYGYKLAQLHACIDILLDSSGFPLFRLRTGIKDIGSIVPINELKKRKKKETILKKVASL